MKRIAAAALCALLAGCAGFGGLSNARSALPVGGPLAGSASMRLSHVVVIIQENRTLNNFFAGYPNATTALTGCALPTTTTTGTGNPRVRPATTSDGCPAGDVVVTLKQIGFGPGTPDLQHDWHSSKVSYHGGRMDGFSKFGQAGAYEAYDYVSPKDSAPYWEIAKQYVLADEMFPTEFGGSFTGHLTAIAGNDDLRQNPVEAEVDFPNGMWDDCDSPAGTTSSYISGNDTEHYQKAPFPCFDQWNTIANPLDKAKISWKIYAMRHLDGGFWEPFEAMKYVRYGPDWVHNIVAPETQVLQDASNNNLASVDFVTPSKPDSDHPAEGSDGPSWVGNVINAIGQSPYWNSTAIIVIWDDYGGWYDPVKPPQPDFRGLGIRVPCLIVSPYAKQNYVSHVPYEFGSILRFIEEVYGIPAGAIGPESQGYTDMRATSLDDAFDFTQEPRKFTPFKTRVPPSHFIHERPTNEPIDWE